MHVCVTFGAERDQVVFFVATRLAAELAVVYLQVLHAAADLASPVRRAPAPSRCSWR